MGGQLEDVLGRVDAPDEDGQETALGVKRALDD